MPQFVEIPAPVTTMVFLERAIESAIVCNCREQSDVTVSIGIFEEVVFVFVRRLYVCKDSRVDTKPWRLARLPR
jgi:hypothetical protein